MGQSYEQRMSRRDLALGVGALSLSSVMARARDGWGAIDAAVDRSIAAGEIPGVVFQVGHRGKIIYHKAFGLRSVRPQAEPMTTDTIFDVASITKPVATASSIMALVQDGRLRLNSRVADHWPEWGQEGKELVTIRQLLTHTSGLSAWAPYHRELKTPDEPEPLGYREQVLTRVAARKLDHPPDSRFVYSDLGFITLGEIVRRVSGVSIELFARDRIFMPLEMRETGYTPPPEWRPRVAPTTERGGRFLRGAVHDENAFISGGIAGHAGLFSTTNDLGRLCRMMLSSDRESREKYPLSPYTVRRMTTPQTPPGLPRRGLGWDIDTAYSHVRGDLLPLGSFGHTGFTGAYIWIDPYSETYIIGLSNRLHPDGKGNPLKLWARVANITAGMVRADDIPARPLLAPAP